MGFQVLLEFILLLAINQIDNRNTGQFIRILITKTDAVEDFSLSLGGGNNSTNLQKFTTRYLEDEFKLTFSLRNCLFTPI